MGNLGVWEILLIMVVVLLVFGAKRLPEVGGSIGKGIREFKRSLTDTSDAIMGDEHRTQLPPRQFDASQPPAPPSSSGEPKWAPARAPVLLSARSERGQDGVSGVCC